MANLTVCRSLFVAAGLLLSANAQSAEAAVTVPALGPGVTQGFPVQDAAWACGPRKCVWVRGYLGGVPPFARAWGPPRYADCYWKRGLLRKWKYRCPA